MYDTLFLKEVHMKKIAIVGAGPGGLAAGMILSSKGYHVDMYEKDDRIGGRSKRLFLGDYMFSQGPSLIVYIDAYKWLFEAAGLDFDTAVKCTRLDPIYQLNKKDDVWNVPGDYDRLKADVATKFNEKEAYEAFMKKEAKTVKAMHPVMMRPFHSRLSLINKHVFNFGKFVGFGSVERKLNKTFQNDSLKDIMQFQTKYLGMTPQETPGFFTMLSYLEHVDGIYHIAGGVPHLMDVFATQIKRFGGHIHVSSKVEKILTDRGVATGVRVNGEDRSYDAVIVNADMPYMVETLLDAADLKKYTQKNVAKKAYSVSAYMLYLGIKKKLDYPVHTLLLADDYPAYTQSLKENTALTDDMSLYIYHPSQIDPSFAKEGHSSLMILAPVPNCDSPINWDEEKTAYKAKVLAQLAKRLPFSAADIDMERIYTPADWEKSGVYKGATFAMKHTMNQLLHKRPHNRYEDVKNMYLVGGSTHPGSGLPIIFESAIIVANLIDQASH